MSEYRRRMRESGLRPVQIWLPDTRSPQFAHQCRQQSRAVAAHDPAGDELLAFISLVNDGMNDRQAD
jgi:hypothetical protein